MRNVIKILALIVFPLLLAANQAVAAKTLEVEFAYSEPAASYNVYMDGSKLCSAPSGLVKKISCNDLVINYGVHLFTMTAVAADGVESKHGPAYTWSYVHEPGDGPVMLNLSITLESGVVIPIGKIAVQQ